VIDELTPVCDEIYEDRIGNVICIKRATKKPKGDRPLRVVLAAHIDEYGFIVQGINKDGYIRVSMISSTYTLMELPIIIHGKKKIRGIIALKKEGELTGLGALAAIKATKSGLYEYHLNAAMQKVYYDGGARGEGYVPIISGSKNAGDSHYHYNNSVLEDGDSVLLDCAPDYHNYTSDIGRMWPINGNFDAFQSALYGGAYHKMVLSLIKPGATRTELHEDAKKLMTAIFKDWQFVSDEQRETACILFDFKGHISHGVGMCVHDGSLHHQRPFEVGMVFAVDPMAWDAERDVHYRVEDIVFVTENGCENLTAVCPFEIEEIEREMV
jgi:Xaa-Pro aminopeptidase